MSNIINIPLEDNFKTSLSQSWTWWVGTVNVVGTPNFTFPSGVTTYIVVNPWNTNMQIATINAYDGSAKTLTVSDITLEKWASVNSIAQTHNVWSEVIISDNYQFWSDMLVAINSKVDGDTQPFPSYTTTNRDLISASNGMMVYNTTTWELNQYIGWAWSAVSSWSTQSDASETVAGKVELPTDAEVTAKTATGGTGATLTPTNDQIGKSVALKVVNAELTETDHIVFDNGGTDNKMLISVFREELSANVATKWTSELATDLEFIAWTDETRYVNSKQVKEARDEVFVVDTAWYSWASSFSIVYNHSLWKAPRHIACEMNAKAAQFWNSSWWYYDSAYGHSSKRSANTTQLWRAYDDGTDYYWLTVTATTTTTFTVLYTESWSYNTAIEYNTAFKLS